GDGVGIKPQTITYRCGDGFGDARRGRVGILVRIQLDVGACARLLARHVTGHRAEMRLEIITHPACSPSSFEGARAARRSSVPSATRYVVQSFIGSAPSD